MDKIEVILDDYFKHMNIKKVGYGLWNICFVERKK